MARNIVEMIVMIRHILMSESRTVLRTMVFGAGLLLLLACTGTAAGATTWFVDDDGGAGYASAGAAG